MYRPEMEIAAIRLVGIAVGQTPAAILSLFDI